MTKREATEQWIEQGMSRIPLSVIEKLCVTDEVREITAPSVGDTVGLYNGGYGEILAIKENEYGEKLFDVERDDDGRVVHVSESEFELSRDSYLPAWGTLWTFDDSADTCWVEQQEGVEALSRCGFRVYDVEDYGRVFGIDGYGYDFIEAHFMPLYDERGLQWHDRSMGSASEKLTAAEELRKQGINNTIDMYADEAGIVIPDDKRKEIINSVYDRLCEIEGEMLSEMVADVAEQERKDEKPKTRGRGR